MRREPLVKVSFKKSDLVKNFSSSSFFPFKIPSKPLPLAERPEWPVMTAAKIGRTNWEGGEYGYLGQLTYFSYHFEVDQVQYHFISETNEVPDSIGSLVYKDKNAILHAPLPIIYDSSNPKNHMFWGSDNRIHAGFLCTMHSSYDQLFKLIAEGCFSEVTEACSGILKHAKLDALSFLHYVLTDHPSTASNNYFTLNLDPDVWGYNKDLFRIFDALLMNALYGEIAPTSEQQHKLWISASSSDEFGRQIIATLIALWNDGNDTLKELIKKKISRYPCQNLDRLILDRTSGVSASAVKRILNAVKSYYGFSEPTSL